MLSRTLFDALDLILTLDYINTNTIYLEWSNPSIRHNTVASVVSIPVAQISPHRPL